MIHMPKYFGGIVVMSSTYFDICPQIRWIYEWIEGHMMHSGEYMVFTANYFQLFCMVKHFRNKVLQKEKKSLKI